MVLFCIVNILLLAVHCISLPKTLALKQRYVPYLACTPPKPLRAPNPHIDRPPSFIIMVESIRYGLRLDGEPDKNHIFVGAPSSILFCIFSPLYIPGQYVAVKTGTTDNKRDNWTIGYTSDYVVTVWVGNNDNSPMSPYLASGITGAAPIWNRIMTLLLANHPAKQPSIPSDIVERICFGRVEYFIRGTENSANCSFKWTLSP
ncbi:MAG: hypothetical protein QW303_06260, partial [Nitrososphaerota archaeon]